MQYNQLVIFDLDGVLVDTAKFHFRAWKRLLGEFFGIEHTADVDEMTKGVGRYACMHLIAQQYHITATEEELKNMADLKNEYYQELLQSELDESSALPGAKQALSFLKEHGIYTALASSSYNAPFVLDRLKLVLDYYVDPATVVRGKPAPDIYLAAAKHFEIPIQNCIGIEDAVSVVAAVKAAGMYCIGIGSADVLRNADFTLPGTQQLPAFLEQLFCLSQKENLNWTQGFCVPFHPKTGRSPVLSATARSYSQMASAYTNSLSQKGNDPLVYQFYELGAPECAGDLSFGTSILEPGVVGDEYYMTKGHFHQQLATAEVYYVLSGEGYLLAENELGDCRSFLLFPGNTVYVPKGYAHRTVNTGETKLVLFFVYRADAGHDYKTIEKKGFHHLTVKNAKGYPEIIKNPKWC